VMANKDDILDLANERFKAAETAGRENRKEAKDDLEFLKGDQWPADAKRMREAEQRPCLTINKHQAFLRQVVNDQRQNRPAIHVHPANDGASKEVALILEGMARSIEYVSKADICYDTAVQGAASAGFGFFRFITDYESETSFDQVIKFDRIRNPLAVRIDPSSKQPDASDMNWCFIESSMARSEFKKEYPNAELSNEQVETEDDIVIVEYYSIERKADELIQLSNGESGFKSDLIELPFGVTILKRRPSYKRKVMWRKLAGRETKVSGSRSSVFSLAEFKDVLEETEIPCHYIPVFMVIGSEVDIEGEVTYSGIIRDSKDSARMYNFWMTSATEEVSMRPKTPYIGAEGQFAGHEEQWRQANIRSFSYLEYKPKAINGILAPPPSRQPMADVPQGVLQMAMHASDEIKAVTGIYDASLGARGNETSGVAIGSRKQQSDLSNFHYTDNLHRTVRHAGQCLIDMIPKVYSGERIVQIIGRDDSISHAPINSKPKIPQLVESPDGTVEAVQQILNDVTVGKYSVIVQAGPSYSSLREEARAAMMEMAGTWPKLMDVAGDEVVKAMDWPGAANISDRILKTIPPEFRTTEGEEQQQIPPQVREMMSQATEYIKQLEQALQEAQSGVAVAQIKAESDQAIAAEKNQTQRDIEELKGMIALLLKSMEPPPQLASTVSSDTAKNDSAPPAGRQGTQAQ